MRLGAHQPHSFPWLGYLHKVATSDVFVVMDDLQFEAQNFQNRNRVKINNGATWLTIPVARGSQEDRICDKRIAPASNPKDDWRRKTWITLRTHYGKAPFFDHYARTLEETFAREWATLLEFDVHMLKLCMEWFGIETPLLFSSSLELQGQKSERIIHMCQRVGADTYVSGKGGSTSYLDLDAFARAGISVSWQSFEHPVYPQRYPAVGFIKCLAALDLLLNCGPESRHILLGGTH